MTYFKHSRTGTGPGFSGRTSERIRSYDGGIEIPYVVDLGRGHVANLGHIINHDRLKRMDSRGQLAPVELVHKPARRSRYAHSLGVYNLARNVVGLSIVHPDKIKMDELERFLLCATSLMHDIGHGPYSHPFEIVAKAYGLKNHKQRSLEIIGRDMKEAIVASTNGNFRRVDVVGELLTELQGSGGIQGPIARLVSDKDRLDKLEYVNSDAVDCGFEPQIDIITLLKNLVFDGSRSGIRAEAKNYLRKVVEGLMLNNQEIYLSGPVQMVEQLWMTAAAYTIDDARFGQPGSSYLLDPNLAYDMTDRELDDQMRRHPTASIIFNSIQKTDIRDGWVPVAYIKHFGKANSAKAEMQMLGASEALIGELSESEILALGAKFCLKESVGLQRLVAENLGLAPDDFGISVDPQIERLMITEMNIAYVNGGTETMKLENIVGSQTKLADDLRDRLQDHHTIRIFSKREHAAKVLAYIEDHGGPVGLIGEYLAQTSKQNH